MQLHYQKTLLEFHGYLLSLIYLFVCIFLIWFVCSLSFFLDVTVNTYTILKRWWKTTHLRLTAILSNAWKFHNSSNSMVMITIFLLHFLVGNKLESK